VQYRINWFHTLSIKSANRANKNDVHMICICFHIQLKFSENVARNFIFILFKLHEA